MTIWHFTFNLQAVLFALASLIGVLLLCGAAGGFLAMFGFWIPKDTPKVQTHPEVLEEERKRQLDAAFRAVHPKFRGAEGPKLRPGFTRDHSEVVVPIRRQQW